MTVTASLSGMAVGGTVYTATGSVLSAAKGVGFVAVLAVIGLAVLEILSFLHY